MEHTNQKYEKIKQILENISKKPCKSLKFMVQFWCSFEWVVQFWCNLHHFPIPDASTLFFGACAERASSMVGQLISIRWRAEKCVKDWMSKNKTKQTKQKHKTTPTQNPEKTSSNLSETVKLRFRTTNPSDHSVPLHSDVGNSTIKICTRIAQCSTELLCMHPSQLQGRRGWFTHVLVDEAAQGMTP